MPEPPPRPPIAREPLSVVLPVRNAAGILKELVAGWQAVLKELERDTEIIVVDDGSSDGMAAAADALSAEGSPVHVLRLSEAQGVGAVFRLGLVKAQHPLVVFAAGDLRYQPADLKKLLEQIDKADFVSGRRTAPPMPGLWRWTGRLYRWTVRIAFGIPLEPLQAWLGWKNRLYHWIIRTWTGARCSDINCPFKLYRKDMLARIPVQSDGPFVHGEILAKANFLECPLAEADVTGPADDPTQELRSLLREAWRVLSHPEFRVKKKAEPRSQKKKRKGK